MFNFLEKFLFNYKHVSASKIIAKYIPSVKRNDWLRPKASTACLGAGLDTLWRPFGLWVATKIMIMITCWDIRMMICLLTFQANTF